MLAPLWHGAGVVVGHDQAMRDMRATAEQIVGAGVTAAHFVPSVLRAYLRTVEVDTLGGLRYLFLGGEACDAALLRRLRPLHGTRVFNQYGPTETCIDSTWFECTGLDFADGDAVPIGRAIDGTRAVVLDDLGGTGGSAGRVGDRRRGARLGLSERSADHGRAVRPGPDHAARRSDLPHRRPGPGGRRRPAGVSRPSRRAGQGQRGTGRAAEVRAALSARCPGAEVAVGSWAGPGEEVRLVAFVAERRRRAGRRAARPADARGPAHRHGADGGHRARADPPALGQGGRA
nr:hypothetical protein GCM10020092_078540 [Actinoplanes digitatis]